MVFNMGHRVAHPLYIKLWASRVAVSNVLKLKKKNPLSRTGESNTFQSEVRHANHYITLDHTGRPVLINYYGSNSILIRIY